MNNIGIFNETDKEVKELVEVEKVINYALKYENLDNVEFNIIIVGNDKIKEINKDYRHIDAVTDVISFALEDFKDVVHLDRRILGDIYISVDKAISQSEEYGHSFLREISFLAVHGLLHLLGYDHMNKDDEEIMFKKQEDILNEYGIKR